MKDPVEAFLLEVLPKVGEALIPAVVDYYAARPLLPVPPSIQPWLDINSKHNARVAARRKREGK